MVRLHVKPLRRSKATKKTTKSVTTAKKTTKARSSKMPGVNAAERTRVELQQLFERERLDLSGSVVQSLEILDSYLKRHLLDAEPVILREILRLLHRMMPKGPQKSKVRGILGKITTTEILIKHNNQN